jgi:hypothetical protein
MTTQSDLNEVKTSIETPETERLETKNSSDFMASRSWIPLDNHPNFEITSDEPFLIRKLRTNGQYRIVNQNLNQKLHYYYVRLEKNMPFHRVIAEQFIPNPENLPQIDHKNHDRIDNRLENLRWVSVSVNACNKTKVKSVQQLFIGELPDGYVPFTEYLVRPERRDPKTGEIIPADVRKLPDLFVKWELKFDEDGTQRWIPHFITYDSKHQYRELQPDKNNKRCVKTRDENRKVTSISFSKVPVPDDFTKPNSSPQEENDR